ncbi:MAG: peptidoglycan bridge formation glycyltransferase FemA/FemB family protein [Chloroflexota bacterium]
MMPEVSLAQWNDFLRNHPQAHFLQTGEWGELKSRFGWQAARLLVDESGAQVLFRRLPLGFSVAYIAKTTAAQISRSAAESFWSAVDALCRQKRAILCKYEPDSWTGSGVAGTQGLTAIGPGGRALLPSAHSVQPRRTVVVDLRPTEDAILGRMKQKCRYNIRLAEKKGVIVRVWEDAAAFHQMIVTTARRDGFAVHSAAYHRLAYELLHAAGLCELLVAEYDGRPLAALMVIARGHRAWYVYGGSTEAERERMPNYLLQWEAMRWARSRGCDEYDLWGVPDEDEPTLEADFADRSDGLWGVYRFKRGFGGELRRAAQAIDRVYNPLLYRAYLLRTSAREAV